MLPTMIHTAEQRLHQISLARQALLVEGRTLSTARPEAWIERSWQRCLQAGQRPDQPVSFDGVPRQAHQRIADANHGLLSAARPVLHRLGRAIADTRYFAILTNADGIVVDVNGPVDRSDRRADLIARIGVDLSEQRVGTTAIGAALTERQPVWLHRGEHFFADNGAYSCAGAPLVGPDGLCVGMLDLTGIDVVERPELKHLVTQSARSIENALTLARSHSLLVRLNWPGHVLGDDTDGLICLDADGYVLGANPSARQMASQLLATVHPNNTPMHCSELFALPFELLFDAARREGGAPMEVPLWSGLRLQALPQLHGQVHAPTRPAAPTASTANTDHRPLRDVETALIRKAVDDARGNVMQAARELGISRATVYRKLGNKKGH